MGRAFFPLDGRLKLTAYKQTTRRLERLSCEVGVRLPYAQAATVLQETLNITMSGKQVARITEAHGQRAVRWRDAELAAAWDAPEAVGWQPPGPHVLYIEADGAWVNSREQLEMEGKVGLVHQGPKRVGRNRMQLQAATYVVSFAGSARLGEELYLEADRQGLERADTVVVLGDGAAWVRALHQEHFYDALYVLDWFHLGRAVHAALQPATVELGADYVAAVRMTLRDLLWFGEVALALNRLDRLRGQLAHADARDAITDLMRYLRTNQDGIRYAELDARGIHVGSGPVEKAGDLIINRRCELRGMTWYRDSANAICNLRALRFNDPQRWADFWN
ncbi:MAG: hypothetical protein Kow00120_14080 [Anaerolineae bacterium]